MVKYFLIALAGDGSEETYEALRSGGEMIPAPSACTRQLLADMRSDKSTPPDERPMALVHVENSGFVASCQIYTTYGENPKDPANKRTIQIRRMSLAPLDSPVPVEALRSGYGPASEGLARKLTRGVLKIDQALFDAVVRAGMGRSAGAASPKTGGSTMHGARLLVSEAPRRSVSARPTEDRLIDASQVSTAAPPSRLPAAHAQPYGTRRAGQYAREQYLDAVGRFSGPPRRWLGFANGEESKEAFDKRVRALDKAEEKYGAGARGEEGVGYLLDQIGIGFFVFHDLEIKDSYGRVRRNVDHVVIGPSGVFAVETKNLSGTPLVSTPGEIRTHPAYKDAERGLDGAVEQAREGAAFVESLLGLHHGRVKPLLCIFRGFVVGDGVVEGDLRNAAVHVLPSKKLLNHIRAYPDLLPESEAQELADSLRDRESRG